MNKLETQALLKRAHLKADTYFTSLLQEAYRVNLLSEPELNRIQAEALSLLARQVDAFTGGRSSSVKVETAANIWESVFYTIGFYLKSFSDLNLALKIIKENSLLQLYKRGRKLVEIQFYKAKQLFTTIQGNCPVINNYAYNATIEKGIPLFFATYDLNFAAHETPGSIDYPVSNDQMELVGIEYISGYLKKLFWENRFCQKFSPTDINILLRSYDENYYDLLINVFELVLTNALGCLFVKEKAVQLDIEPLDRKYLQDILGNLSPGQLSSLMDDTIHQLCQELAINESFLVKLIKDTATKLPANLKNALATNRLAAVFISFKKSPPPPIIHFEDGLKIDDQQFRKIVEKIRSCRYLADKIALIQSNLHSIADLVDILEGSCLFGAEFDAFFRVLGDMELALLQQRVPPEIMDPSLRFTERGQEWQHRLAAFLQSLAPTRKEKIGKICTQLRQTKPN